MKPSRMRLPAVAWRSRATTRVLERHRDAQERWQRRDRRLAPGSCLRKALVGRGRGRPRRPLVHRQPGVDGGVGRADGGEVRVEQFAAADLARTQARGHLVSMEARQRRVGGHRSVVAVAEHGGYDEVLGGALGCVGQGRFAIEAGSRTIVAQHVLQLDDARRRRDGLGVELVEHGELLEDVIELSLELGHFLLGQPEAREMGDVLDVTT